MPVPRAVRALFILALSLPSLGGAGTQYFVSPEGDDAWTGLQPEKAFFGSGGPYRTLARAQRALRELKAKGVLIGETRIVLAQGEYMLPEGLSLGPEDLGNARASITYMAAPEANVVFRGDVLLAEWRREPAGPYRAKLPPGDSLALFAKDEALHKARYPNLDPSHPRSGGFCYVSQAEAAAGTLFLRLTGAQGLASESWSRMGSATLHIWPDHGPRQSPQVSGATAASRTICLAQRPDIVPGTRLFFEGLPDELDAPGEWQAVPGDGIVRVVPPDDCDPRGDITAAATACLVRIEGQGAVRFEGIEFRGSAGDLVQIDGAECVFERCLFRLCEGDAVVAARSSGLRVEGCDFRQIGGTALRLSASPNAVVRNCWIGETGFGRPTEAAIVLDDECSRATISRNLLHDLPGSGILLRGAGHRCERNVLHDLGLEGTDGAGIVVSGSTVDAPTAVSGNVVMDPGGYRRESETTYAFPSGMAGIAVLDGSGARVGENLLLRGSLAEIHASGRGHAIENNLLVGGGRAHIDIGAAAGLVIRRNVVLDQGEDTAWIRGSRLFERVQESDWNVLWGYADDPIVEEGGSPMPWDDWQHHGFDRRSVQADPLCRAPELDEYELLPQSLALKLGFVPLAPDEAGCYADSARRTWPIDDEIWREKHLNVIPRSQLGSDSGK